jgi:hypothetical protein
LVKKAIIPGLAFPLGGLVKKHTVGF